MISFEKLVRQTLIGSFFLLVLSVASWFFFTDFRRFLAGFALGAAFSLVNGAIAAIKTVQINRIALSGEKKRVYGTGQLQRLIIAGFAGYVSVSFPRYFHYAGAILGLMTVTLLSFFYSLLYYWKKRLEQQRGKG
jgi:hypothetical protein